MPRLVPPKQSSLVRARFRMPGVFAAPGARGSPKDLGQGPGENAMLDRRRLLLAVDAADIGEQALQSIVVADAREIMRKEN